MKQLLPIFAGIIFLCSTSVGYAQKKKKIKIYEVNDSTRVVGDTVIVNGKAFALIESWRKHTGGAEDFKIKSIQGKDIIVMRFFEYYNPYKSVSGTYYNGTHYYEFLFLDSGQKCQIEASKGWMNRKDIALELLRNNLIVNNTENTHAVDFYVQINGMSFSEDQQNMYELKKLSLQQPQNNIIQKTYIKN